jgi:hypothetical protein
MATKNYVGLLLAANNNFLMAVNSMLLSYFFFSNGEIRPLCGGWISTLSIMLLHISIQFDATDKIEIQVAEFCYVQSLSPLDTVISRSFGGVVLYTHWLCSQKACGQLGACVLSFIVILKP